MRRNKRIKRIGNTRRYWDICKDLNRETMGSKHFFLTFLFFRGLLEGNEDRDDVGDKIYDEMEKYREAMD